MKDKVDKKFSDYHKEVKKQRKNAPVADVVVPANVLSVPVVEEKQIPVQKEIQETVIIKEQVILDKIDIVSLNEGIHKLVEKTESLLQERKEQNEQNKLLLETLNSLANKLEALDKSIKSIKNIEIPTPIVNVTMPERKVIKTPVRDEKGIITHVIEEDYKEDKKE